MALICVSWCVKEIKFTGVYEGEMWFKHHDKWKDKNCTPSSGDIIFFDWKQNGYPDHVGVVEKVEDRKIYTIEGNSSDEVREKSYSLNYKAIQGYGIQITK